MNIETPDISDIGIGKANIDISFKGRIVPKIVYVISNICKPSYFCFLYTIRVIIIVVNRAKINIIVFILSPSFCSLNTSLLDMLLGLLEIQIDKLLYLF